MNLTNLFDIPFIAELSRKDIYDFFKDFIVPIFSIGASVFVAYWVANRQIKDQRNLLEDEEARKSKLLFNLIDVQTQLLIEESRKRDSEIRKLIDGLEEEDIYSDINEVYMPSLIRLNEIDYKEIHNVFFEKKYDFERNKQVFLLYQNSLIHLERGVIMINNSGRNYYTLSLKNYNKLKELYDKFNFEIGEILSKNKYKDCSFFQEFDFDTKILYKASYLDFFKSNLENIIEPFYKKVKEDYREYSFNLLKLVTEIRNLVTTQKLNLDMYKYDLEFYLQHSEDNIKNLKNMESVMYDLKKNRKF